MIHPNIRYTHRGVPVLSRKQIDAIAEEYLADFRPEYLKDPQPVDVDKFAVEYMNFRQDFQYLSNSGIYLGMFVFSDTDAVEVYDPEMDEAKYASERADTIVIDRTLLETGQEGRYRFTMGHEIAHGLFHRPKADPYQEYLRLFYGSADGSRDMIFRCGMPQERLESEPEQRWTDGQWKEWQADVFSSSLLMPKTMVEQIARKRRIDQKDPYAREMLVTETARTFDVTVTAARVRLSKLGILRPLEEKPVSSGQDVPEIVRRMRERALERAEMRKADEDIFNKRDEDLWNNVDGPVRTRRRKRR